ncbi:MAG: hypothetical protein ALAOOOJD_02234 [bacterium]|nr:hypothetical protein [bacterium]
MGTLALKRSDGEAFSKIMNQARHNFFARPPFLSIAVLLLSLFLFLSITVPVAAQPDPTEARVKAGWQELKDALAKAKEIVPTFENREARELLTKAEALLHEAEAKYTRALTMNDNRLRELLLKEALANLVLGKSHVDRAVKLTLDLPLNRLRNTLAELMRRAEQNVLGQNNREAQRLVYQARKTQLDAERVITRDPRRAFEFYQIAIALVEKALALVEGRKPSPDATLETTLNREKERYENLAKRAQEAVETSQNTAAALVLAQAQKQARTAEEAFRKGEIAIGQQLYRGATRLLLRVIHLAMLDRKGQDFGRNEIALLQDLIQNAEQETQGDADPRAALFLERARVLAREAEGALERQQPQEAKWRVELARNFVDKAMRKAERGALTTENMAQRFNEALQELAGDIQEVDAKVRESNKTEAAQLVELATNAYKAAETAGRRDRLVLGFQLIRLAQHLLLRAETLWRDTAAPGESMALTRETVLSRVTQVESAAQEISNTGDAETCQTVQAQALEMSKRSRAALERGQLRLAVAIVEVANDLLENCKRK